MSAALEERFQRGVRLFREWIDYLDAAPDKAGMQILCQQETTAGSRCDRYDDRIPDAEPMRGGKVGSGTEGFGRRVGDRKGITPAHDGATRVGRAR